MDAGAPENDARGGRVGGSGLSGELLIEQADGARLLVRRPSDHEHDHVLRPEELVSAL